MDYGSAYQVLQVFSPQTDLMDFLRKSIGVLDLADLAWSQFQEYFSLETLVLHTNNYKNFQLCVSFYTLAAAAEKC